LFRKDPIAASCISCAIDAVPPAIDGRDIWVDEDCDDERFIFLTASDGGWMTGVDQCLATVACELGLDPVSSPAPAASWPTVPGPLNAYCGTESASACRVDTTPPGQCEAQITAGFPIGTTPSDIFDNLTTYNYPSGFAGTIIDDIHAASCDSVCF
jgi:hypothetical protein